MESTDTLGTKILLQPLSIAPNYGEEWVCQSIVIYGGEKPVHAAHIDLYVNSST